MKKKIRSPKLIGIVFAGMIKSGLNHPFFSDVLNTIHQELGNLGYDMLIISNGLAEKDENYLERCRAARVEGCIIIGGDDVQDSIYALDRSEIPCIGIDIKLSGNRSGYLMSDNYKLAKKAVEHLYLLGHKDIAYIGGSPMSIVGTERMEGFRRAMVEYGLTINEAWITTGDFKVQGGYQVMKSFLTQKPPTAVFAVSDLSALGAIAAVKEHGMKVPGDIAIVGCDDIESSQYVDPPLTTIRQNKEKIGTLATRMLMDMIDGTLKSSSVMVDAELIVRKSCGAV